MSPYTEWLIRKEYAKRHGMTPVWVFVIILLAGGFIALGKATENFLRTGHFEVPRHTMRGHK